MIICGKQEHVTDIVNILFTKQNKNTFQALSDRLIVLSVKRPLIMFEDMIIVLRVLLNFYVKHPYIRIYLEVAKTHDSGKNIKI